MERSSDERTCRLQSRSGSYFLENTVTGELQGPLPASAALHFADGYGYIVQEDGAEPQWCASMLAWPDVYYEEGTPLVADKEPAAHEHVSNESSKCAWGRVGHVFVSECFCVCSAGQLGVMCVSSV
eukprot:6492651-Amphidinium_carterae.4